MLVESGTSHIPDSGPSGGSVSGLVREMSQPALFREIAEELALRSSRACFTPAVLILVMAILVPRSDQWIVFTAACALAALLIAAARAIWARRCTREYALAPSRWLRLFRAGVYASTLVWALFATSVMTVSAASWPRWMILLITAGISAGATTSSMSRPATAGTLPGAHAGAGDGLGTGAGRARRIRGSSGVSSVCGRADRSNRRQCGHFPANFQQYV